MCEASIVNSFRTAVVVTTYHRPEYLKGCLRSLSQQTRRPVRVVIVAREGDGESVAAIKQFQTETPWMNIDLLAVIEPGPVPAMKRAFDFLKSCQEIDLVLGIDDDAEAEPDWIEVMSRHFNDPAVGLVGGRVITYSNGKLVPLPPAKKVSSVTWYGNQIQDLYKPIPFDHTVEADGFSGANFAIRRELLSEIELDTNFTGSAIMYELDVAFQVKRLKRRILFDPRARVHHLVAPRPSGIEQRDDLQGTIYSQSHNLTYVMMKHLPLPNKLAFLAWFFLIGQRRSWGLLTMIADAILKMRITCRGQVLTSFRGKLDGIRDYLKQRRREGQSIRD